MGHHNCALLEDASVKCWGNNGDGHLGYGDSRNRGDDPGEMGDNLPRVDLGTGRTAVRLSAGAFHRCAILDDGEMKCWGKGEAGQLGYEDSETRGDDPDEMGDNLPAVNVGTGRKAVEISSGDYHTCAVLDDGGLKCWGGGGEGQLGSGHQSNIGAKPNEMGDNLPYVSLGTGRTVRTVATGDYHTCVLLDNHSVKCFGDGFEGQLGYGSRTRIGDHPNEMGDVLPAIDLGTGRTGWKLSAGWYHTCVLLDNGDLKCWGYGGHGQLGQEDKVWYGTAKGHMGDNLPPINLGTGRKAVEVTSGAAFSCAVLDDGETKCWGQGTHGKLGIGNTQDYGDAPGEMGDNLPSVDFGSGRKAVIIGSGDLHSCAVLTDGLTKCWGYNNFGQLGLGNNENHGETPDTLGEHLPPVDLGLAPTTITITQTRTTSTTTSVTATSTVTTTSSTTTTSSSSTTSSGTTTTTTFTSTSTTSTTSSTPTSTVTSTATTTTTLPSTSSTSTSSTSTTVTATTTLTSVTTTSSTSTTTTLTDTSTGTSTSTSSTTTSTTDTSTSTTVTTVTTTMTTRTTTTTSTVTEIPLIIIANATQADTALGFAIDSLPPLKPIRVASTEPGGWADRSGVLPRDQLASVNGIDPASLPPVQLLSLLQQRPLTLTFSHKKVGIQVRTGALSVDQPGLPFLNASADEEASNLTALGLTIDGLPPDSSTRVATLEPGLWAERSGLTVGDRLVSLNGWLMPSLTPEEFQDVLQQTRPLTLVVCTDGNSSGLAPAALRETASWTLLTGVQRLDFSVDSVIGDAMRVSSFTPLLWADRSGLRLGDQLCSLNGQALSGLGAAAVALSLLDRPILLGFSRGLSCGSGEPASWDQALPVDSFVASWVEGLGSGLRPLGLTVESGPLGRASIVTMEQGSWASRSDLLSGDRLVAVNNRTVANMSSFDLLDVLVNMRPLVLVASRSKAPAAPTTPNRTLLTGVGPLGISLDGLPHSRVRVASVANESWAQRSGVAVGQEVLAINGQTLPAADWNESMFALLQGRPLHIVLSTNASAPSCCQVIPVDLPLVSATATSAQPGLFALGLTIEGTPPGPYRIVTVEPGLWAERSGLLPGDWLVGVDNSSLSDLDLDGLQVLLDSRRPVTLVASRSRPLAMPIGTNRTLLTGVDSLGFDVDNLPPSPLRVATVYPKSWANRSGLSLGQEILSVNSQSPTAANWYELMGILRQGRPMQIVLSRSTSLPACCQVIPVDVPIEIANATDSESRFADLGLTLDTAASPLRIAALEPGSWAERSGCLVGHRIIAANARSTSALEPDELLRLLDTERPLVLALSFLQNESAPLTPNRTLLTGETRLGFAVDSLPPDTVRVASAALGSWASRSGLDLGTELLSLNDIPVSALSPKDFLQALQRRPSSPSGMAYTPALSIQLVISTEMAIPSCCQVIPVDMQSPSVIPRVATDSEPDLAGMGLTFIGLPPEPVLVAALDPGSWANRSGLGIRDELVSLNGSDVSNMTPGELMQILQESRPLELLLSRSPPRWYDDPEAQQPNLCQSLLGAPELLGFSVARLPPGRLRVAALDSGGWAERSGLTTGVELSTINGQNASLLAPDDFMRMLQTTRPLSLVFCRGDNQAVTDQGAILVDGPYKTLLNATVTKQPGFSQLGFTCSGFPPEPVRIAALQSGLWASLSGFSVGDQLLFINGMNVSEMSAQQLQGILHKTRPLSLVFSRLLAGTPGNRKEGAAVVPNPCKSNTSDLDLYTGELRLGFSVDTAPPSTVRVREVHPGRWANRSCVPVGAVLAAINGQKVSEMDQKSFKRALLTTRPVALSFTPANTSEPMRPEVISVDRMPFMVAAIPADIKLAFSVAGLPPQTVRVASVEEDGWAKRRGVTVGDELLSLNGLNVSSMSPVEFLQVLGETRPLFQGFSPRTGSTTGTADVFQDILAYPVDKPQYTASAGLGDLTLGFSINGTPPEPVLVSQVQSGEWAARRRVDIGDEVVAVNGLNVSEMSLDELLQALQETRPLDVVFADPVQWVKASWNTSNCSGLEVVATDADFELGLFTSPLMAGTLRVVGVETGMWAQRSGVGVGDVIQQLNGRNVSDLQEAAATELLQTSRPLTVALSRCQQLGGLPPLGMSVDKERGPYNLTATATDPRLAFSLAGRRGQLQVAFVRAESWAERLGVSVGDNLAALNGIPIGDLPLAEVTRMLQDTRPLVLAFVPRNTSSLENTSLPVDDGGPLTALNSDKPSFNLSTSEINLGFSIAGLPPGSVTVSGTESGSWARRFGVAPGDTLLAVNGRNVSTMDPGELMEILRESRPIKLVFAGADITGDSSEVDESCTFYSVTASGSDTQLGLFLSPGGWTVLGVTRGLWAHRSGLLLGDQLQAINGAAVVDLNRRDALWALWTTRPVSTVFARCPPPSDPVIPVQVDQPNYTVTADASEALLGLLVSGSPPEPVFIGGVHEGSWASRSHVDVGDEVLAVNGRMVQNMTAEEFSRLLLSRPLTLLLEPRLDVVNISTDTSDLSAVPVDAPNLTNYSASVMPMDTRLGFTVNALPPSRVFVTSIDDWKWASRVGVSLGAELFAIDGLRVADMTGQDMLQRLQDSRPMTLSLAASPGATSVPWVWASSAARTDAPCQQNVVTAAESGSDLGLFTTPMVNGTLAAAGLVPDLWAERSGLSIGDIILSLNGQNVSEMSQADVMSVLTTTRPLTMTYARCSGATMGLPVDRQRPPYFANATVDDPILGFSLAGLPPERIRVAAIVQNSWVGRLGMEPGDELISVNGTEVGAIDQLALLAALQNSRPLSLYFKTRPLQCPPDARANKSTVNLVTAVPIDEPTSEIIAGEEDERLGFSVYGQPPGRTFVAGVEPESWAARQGVEEGDEVHSIDGRRVGSLTMEEFKYSAQTLRPLKIAFFTATPGSTTPREVYENVSCSLLSLNALAADAELGFFVGNISEVGAPVLGIETGMWAQRLGMLVGDTLTRANGLNVSQMQQIELMGLLQVTRPLALSFSRCSGIGATPTPVDKVIRPPYVANATSSDPALYFSISGTLPSRVRVGAVVSGRWAERCGMQVGDELLSVNGRDVSQMDPGELLPMLQSTRPLSLSLLPRQQWGKSIEGQGWSPDLRVTPVDSSQERTYSVGAHYGHPDLGLAIYGLPPNTMTVGSTVAGLWADKFGLTVGDTILEVNGMQPQDMGSFQFKRHMRDRRPLSMTLLSDPSKADTPGPGASAAHDCEAFPAFAEETDFELGMYLSSQPGKLGAVVGLETNMWAESSGMALGDAIIRINHQYVQDMTYDKLLAELQKRPLSLVFATCGPFKVGVPISSFTVNVSLDEGDLGLAMIEAFEVPEVMVACVGSGGWAERTGVRVGDQLLLVNGDNATTMAPADLLALLKTRPLSLHFLQGDGTAASGAMALSHDGSCTTTLALATDDDSELGLFLKREQGKFIITKTDPLLWSSRSGMSVGDVLLSLNGRDALAMSEAEIMTLLQIKRPLCMVFLRCLSGGSSNAALRNIAFTTFLSSSDGWPGFTPEMDQTTVPPRVMVGPVAPGTWAERSGVFPRDVLIAANGTNVSGMPLYEVIALLNESRYRPLSLDFAHPVLAAPDRPLVAATASRDEQTLGFSSTGVPPEPVTLENVEGGLWAARSGMFPGDELVSINGRNVKLMTPLELNRLLRVVRPLSIVVARPAPPGDDDGDDGPVIDDGAGGAAGGGASGGGASGGGASGGGAGGSGGSGAGTGDGSAGAGGGSAGNGGTGSGGGSGGSGGSSGGTGDPSGGGFFNQGGNPSQGGGGGGSGSDGSAGSGGSGGSGAEDPMLAIPTYWAVASDGVARLGWSPTALPPQLVRVSSVDNEGWAQRSGLSAGDVLLRVNGLAVGSMRAEQLLSALQNLRPLNLTLVHYSWWIRWFGQDSTTVWGPGSAGSTTVNSDEVQISAGSPQSGAVKFILHLMVFAAGILPWA